MVKKSTKAYYYPRLRNNSLLILKCFPGPTALWPGPTFIKFSIKNRNNVFFLFFHLQRLQILTRFSMPYGYLRPYFLSAISLRRTSKDLNFLSFLLPSFSIETKLPQNLDKTSIPFIFKYPRTPKEFLKNSSRIPKEFR